MIEWHDFVDSTNILLKKKAKEGLSVPYAVASKQQSMGRGRMERAFISPPGGLYISFLLPWDDTFQITAKAAVAVKRAIKNTCGLDCKIKWVNDLYYCKKKVCGILAEGAGDKVVLGIGINWASKKEDLIDVAGSLNQDISSLEKLADELEKQVYGHLDGWLEEYRQSSLLDGLEVDVFQAGKKITSGTVCKVDENCHLVVIEHCGKQMVLSTGEVSVKIK